MMGGMKAGRAGCLLALVVSLMAAFAGGAPAGATIGSKPPALEFLGEAIVPTGTSFAGTTVGGLSSIAYDGELGVYYALSDDQGTLQPARFYTLRLDIGDGRLAAGDVHFDSVTTLKGPDGLPYPPLSLDPEGLTLTKDRELVITSEGFATRLISPWVRTYELDGTMIGDLPVPSAFVPTATSGVRQNLAFEAAAVAPNGRFLFVGTEGALVQDGPPATLAGGSPTRLLRYNLQTGRLDRQYVYFADPIAEPPVPLTNFAVNGLVELLPFNNEFMLSMERSFSVGAPDTGNTIKLYTVAVPGADDVNGADSLAASLSTIRPVDKALLLDLDTLGIPLDNVEGMTIGPTLPDGRSSLVLVSDNNFATTQFTQFLLFALSH
jgi:3-phytase